MTSALFPQLPAIQPNATRLYLLRHGEVHANDRKRLYGQADVRLSDLGLAQSVQTGKALSREGFQAVYASDLSRASFLGESIAKEQKITLTIDVALRERSFGHWQGLTWEQIEAQDGEALRAYQADRFSYRVEGGESFEDLGQRVIPAVLALIEKHRGGSLAIAAHSGPARVTLAHFLGLSGEGLFRFDQDYCCLNVIDVWSPQEGRVRVLNSTHHLDQLARGDGFMP